MDQTHLEVARHVGAGEDGMDAGDCLGHSGVDPQHVGPGVVGEAEGGVEDPVEADVVDVVAVPEGQFVTLVLDA